MTGQEEQRRLLVLNEVNSGRLTAVKAAELLDLSERQLRRILAAYRQQGAAAITHGNRGRRPVNALEEEARARIVELARTKYSSFNQLRVSEILIRQEKIQAGQSTVRRILRQAGVAAPDRIRLAQPRSHREHFPVEGLLLHIGSRRREWFDGRGPAMCLIAAIDDATGRLPFALFRMQDDPAGYFLLMEGIARRYGLPVAVHRDRYSLAQVASRQAWPPKVEFASRRDPTQFGRLLEELAIAFIPTRGFQARERIEKLYRGFEERLVAEMRMREVSNVSDANRLLETFLPEYNRRLPVPTDRAAAWRPLPDGLDLDDVFCFKHERLVAPDNTVRFGEYHLQLLPGAKRVSFARATVELRERLDGGLAVYYRGREVPAHSAQPMAEPMHANVGSRAGVAR